VNATGDINLLHERYLRALAVARRTGRTRDEIAADFWRFRSHGHAAWASEGFVALVIYRLQRRVRRIRRRPLAILPKIVTAAIKKVFTLVTHINLHPDAVIGPGMFIPHVGPIQVFPLATIGFDCAIHHVCTIGAGAKPGGPMIGDHVYIACHTCILGPVRIGDCAKIGAGAVVVTDVPAGATAVGVPARVLESSGKQTESTGQLAQTA